MVFKRNSMGNKKLFNLICCALFFCVHAGAFAGALTGRVTDLSGNPVKDAYLIVSGPSSRSCYSSVTGTYTVTGLPDGIYYIYCYPPSGTNYVRKVLTDVYLNGNQTTTLDISLEMGGAISGRVTDQSGNPVYNAYVYTPGPDSKYSYSSSTGVYTIRGIPVGFGYTIYCEKPYGSNFISLSSSNISVEADQTSIVDFVLQPGAIISGRVTDTAGTPVYNAQISVSGPSYNYGYSFSTGGYAVKGLLSGTYTIYCYAPHDSNYISTRTANISASTGQVTTVDFVLQEGNMIRGRVTDQSGNPVYQAYVYTSGNGNYDYSSSTGGYTVRGLVSGTYRVYCDAPNNLNFIDSRVDNVTVNTGQVAEVNFVLQSGGIISGKITDDSGNPVYDARVYLSDSSNSYSGYSSSTGGYTVKGISGGVYTVYCYAPSGSNLNDVTIGNIAVNVNQVTSLDIKLLTGGLLSGRVRDTAGNPVYDARITLSPPYRYSYSSSTGGYTVKGIPGGVYTVYCYAPSGSNLMNISMDNISITGGQTTNLDFVLPAYGILTGIVTDSSGTVVYNAGISVSGPSYTSDYSLSTGGYSVKGLLSGNYTVYCYGPNGSNLSSVRMNNVFISTGQVMSLNFVLFEGGVILGTVADKYGNPVIGANIRTSDGYRSYSSYSLSTGGYRLQGL